MNAIKKLTDGMNQYFPQTHTKAVVDDNGYTAESRLAAMQDEINNIQQGVAMDVAVPSDLTPTEDSTNWVTSGGVFNAIQILSEKINDAPTFLTVLENGLYFVDSNMNIGAFFDNDGFHAINMLEYEKIQ